VDAPDQPRPAASLGDLKPRRRKRNKPRTKKRVLNRRLVAGTGISGLALVIGIVFAVLRHGGNALVENIQLAGGAQTIANNGKPQSEGGTLPSAVVVFDEPQPPLPAAPAQPAPPPPTVPEAQLSAQPAAVAVLPAALPEDTLGGGRTGAWEGKPDPARGELPALPANAFLHLRFMEPQPLLAALGGPFALEIKGNRSTQPDRAVVGDDQKLSPNTPLLVKDLRTGQVVGRFAWKTPVWAQARLSPEAMYVVGPDNKPGTPATTKDGLLFVWKRETAQPVGELKVGGPVIWIDFVAVDKVAVLTFDETPVLQLWDLANAKLEKRTPLPRGEFTPPKYDPSTFRPLAAGEKTYAPNPALGAVSPGGRYLALGGATAIHVIALPDGKRAGAFPVPRKRLWQSGKPGEHTYLGLCFGKDGNELYGMLKTERGWLLTWSLATGLPTNMAALQAEELRGPLLPGPESGTVIVPVWKFDDGFVVTKLRTELGRPFATGAVVDTRNGMVLVPLTVLALRSCADGLLAMNQWKFTPHLPQPPGYENRTLSDYDKLRRSESLVVYVASLDRDAIRQQWAAQSKNGARPPARLGDRTDLVIAKPAPPAEWARPPAPPPPMQGLVGAFHVPNAPALFGDAHVGFVDSYAELNDPRLIASLRPKAQRGDKEAAAKLYAAYKHPAGVHWHRYDLRTGKPAGPVIELWPWATSPFPGTALDFGSAPAALAMTRDGNRIALRDPADAARVDVWDASGKRLLGLLPYGGDTPVQWVGWSSGGRLLTLGSGKFTGWEVPSGKAVFEAAGGYRLPIAQVRGRAWVAVNAGPHIDLLDCEAGRCLGRCAPGGDEHDPSRATDLALAPDGTLLACLAWRKSPEPRSMGALLAWDLNTGQALPVVFTARTPGRALLVLDGRRVLLDGVEEVDLNLRRELAIYLPPPVLTFDNLPHPGGPLPSSPDGRLWSFGPEPGFEDLREQKGPTLVMLRPLDLPGCDTTSADPALVFTKKTPLVVEVDLGSEERGRQFGKSLVTFLQNNGFQIGKGGWRLRASYEVQETEHYMTFKGWLGGLVNIPRVAITWKLYAPDGEVAHSAAAKSEFGQQSKYYKGERIVGKQGPYIQVEWTWEFDKPPRQAMVEELLDGAAKSGGTPLPPLLGKFQGKYQPLPVTTSAVFPPVAIDAGR
jgi:hypothetical protein